jgi:hypothetical protein
LYTV